MAIFTTATRIKKSVVARSRSKKVFLGKYKVVIEWIIFRLTGANVFGQVVWGV